jgi:hypothetical protein
LVYPPTVSPALLLVALTLSVVENPGDGSGVARLHSWAPAHRGRRAVSGTDVPVIGSGWDSWR